MAKLSKELRMGIHNRFDIEVVDVETGKVKQKARGYNTICNSYYTCILNKTQALYIQIGSGSGTPSPSDTGLFSYVGYASDNNTYSPYDRFDVSREHEGIWSRQFKRVIPNNQYVGSTITEIGLATGSSGNNIVTHAILKDMNGNPISIEHTSTDIIYIYCTIYLHYENQHSDIHLWFSKTRADYYQYSQYPYMGLVARMLLSFFGTNGYSTHYAVLGNDSLWGSYYYTSDYQTYANLTRDNMGIVQGNLFETTNAQNKSITFTFPQVMVGQGNVNGLSQIGISIEGGNYDGGNKLTGNSITIEAGGSVFPPSHVIGESAGIGDGSQTKFKTKFNYPYNAVVYVNGVRQNSGVTVKKLPCYAITNNFYPWPLTNCGLQLFKRVFPQDVSLMKPLSALNGDTFWIDDNNTATGVRINANNFGFILADGDAIESLAPEIGIYGIGGSYSGSGAVIKGSNDGITWIDVPISYAAASKPSMMNQDYAHFKYYKNVRNENHGVNIVMNNYDGYNIIFDNPPASGDVITVDYDCDKILKDTDHVLDVSITLTFSEWTGE